MKHRNQEARSYSLLFSRFPDSRTTCPTECPHGRVRVRLVPDFILEVRPYQLTNSTRMGIAFSIVGTSLLIGTPIEGALLHQADGKGYVWHRSIIFCGVRIQMARFGK